MGQCSMNVRKQAGASNAIFADRPGRCFSIQMPAYMIIMTPRSMPMAVSFHRGITPAEYSAISTTGIKMLTQKKMPNFLFINR